MKKAISILLSFVMMIGITAGIDFSAYAAIGGDLGTGVSWSFDESTGALSFTGKGNIPLFGIETPWYNVKDKITKINFSEGVTEIASLHDLTNLKNINLPNTIISIQPGTFNRCLSLETVNLSNKLIFIGTDAFKECSSLLNFTINGDTNGRGEPFPGVWEGTTAGDGYFVKDGVLFSNHDEYYTDDLSCYSINHNCLEKYPSGRTNTKYSIPVDTMSIANNAFSSLKHLETIIIPSSVKGLFSESFAASGKSYEHPITLIFQHTTFPGNKHISADALYNLLPGSKIVVKNDKVKAEFEANAANFIYNKDGNNNVEIVAQNTPTTSLTLNENNISLKINETTVLQPTQAPFNTTDNLVFSSTDNYIVSFDKYSCGRLTAKGVGTTTITITSGSVSVTRTVTVTCDHTKTHIVNYKNATCTKYGYTGDTVCDDCGKTISKGTAISKIGHNLVKETSKKPTCTTPGYTGATICTNCGTVTSYSQTTPALGHDVQSGKCVRCKKAFLSESTKNEISFTEPNVKLEYVFIPSKSGHYTFYSEGNSYARCEIYNQTETLVTKSETDRPYANFNTLAQNLKAGKEYYVYLYTTISNAPTMTLIVKPYEQSDEYLGHEHSYTSKKVSPTCTEKGYTLYKCKDCGYSYKINYVNAKGHTYKNYITKATSRANGSIVNKCSVCGTKNSTTTIPLVKIFTLSATNYNYDGKVKTPAVTVKDSKGKTLRKGTDYDVTYSSGRKNVGKYAVKITLKGNYAGTKTLYFNINPKGTSIVKVTPKSKAFTVSWKKQTNQTTGYQIQYSTYSNFKSVKTITMPKSSYYAKSITGLAGNKRYYVRIRTYKTVRLNGNNYNLYSPWSSAKYKTTKR